MGADSDGGQAKGGASGKGGAKGDGNGAGKKTKSTSSQTARKVSCPLISNWASASARAPDFLRFRHRLTLSSSILKGISLGPSASVRIRPTLRPALR